LAQFGGAGDALLQLQTALSGTSSSTNDYTPANIGQLKNLTAPIFDRLLAVGYQLTPLKSGSLYPWAGGTPNDYAMANIGQVKYLFSFDLTLSSDGSGLPDWWRHLYGIPPGTSGTSIAPGDGGLTYFEAFNQGLNPNDYYNGQIPAVAISSGNWQTANPGDFEPLPLLVTIKNSNNEPVVGAPAVFTVTDGGGILQASKNTSPANSITVLTDANGVAKAFFRTPNISSATSHITATAGVGIHQANGVFEEYSDDGTGSYGVAASDVVATVNSDGSLDVSWTNNTDPDDPSPITLQYKDRDGNWQTLTVAVPGASSCHLSAP